MTMLPAGHHDVPQSGEKVGMMELAHDSHGLGEVHVSDPQAVHTWFGGDPVEVAECCGALDLAEEHVAAIRPRHVVDGVRTDKVIVRGAEAEAPIALGRVAHRVIEEPRLLRRADVGRHDSLCAGVHDPRHEVVLGCGDADDGARACRLESGDDARDLREVERPVLHVNQHEVQVGQGAELCNAGRVELHQHVSERHAAFSGRLSGSVRLHVDLHFASLARTLSSAAASGFARHGGTSPSATSSRFLHASRLFPARPSCVQAML